jgi:signal peptidase I
VGDGRDAVVAGLSCASCGTELPPKSKVCTDCGAAVVPAPEPAEPKRSPENAGPDAPGTDASATPADVSTPPKPKWGVLRKALAMVASVVFLLVVLGAFGSRVVAQLYHVPSESMAPTLNAGEHIIVNKLTYRSHRLGLPQPGDVVVFYGPPGWNAGYQSIRSPNTAVRWLQNVLSFVGFVPPDENHPVSRIIAVGGQTVQCRVNTGITVDGEPVTEPYLDLKTLGLDPSISLCLGPEFGPVRVPRERLWVMGDNRTRGADSRAHCISLPADLQRGIACTGDPMSGTIPVENVIGKAWQF